MNTKHKPVTPLPWKDSDGCPWALKTNAPYITHAANAYPRLVAALERIAEGHAMALRQNYTHADVIVEYQKIAGAALKEIGEA